MNVAVILEYFEYLLHFPKRSAANAYFFCTVHRKHVRSGAGHVTYCDWGKYTEYTGSEPIGAWTEYFKAGARLKMLSPGVDYQAVARLYESFFAKFFARHRIDILVCGGTTGFERCGIATAKRMGVKTLCVWEGQFRPDTISYDPDGMNAESAFYRIPYAGFIAEPPSDEALRYIRDYVRSSAAAPETDATLRRIHRGKFDILAQAGNRWRDRNDLERIRLPLWQHAHARISYWIARNRYTRPADAEGAYIFFPLQTHTDSNIAINSEAVPFRRCVDSVIAAFRSAYAGTSMKLVIKEHPFDVFRIAYDRGSGGDIVWCAPETSVPEILTNSQCRGVVVVNSTAGFESLLAGKPVVALGRSTYAREELALLSPSLETKDIAGALARLGERTVDGTTVETYAARLFEKTQFIGNLDRIPAEEEIIRFELLLKRIVAE